MTAPLNPNSGWCRLIAAELAALGIADVVTSPGTRSAALVSALAEHVAYRLHVMTDERTAGFFALGLVRSLRRPVAVCVTSGSAVANLMPALAEAHANAMPLLALTCDRPKASRGAGQPQTTRQAEFCRPLLAELVDLDDPETSADARETMCTRLRALAPRLDPATATGPVQLNVPLLGRMTSVDGIHGWGQAEFAPTPAIPPQHAAPLRPAAAASGADADALIARFALRPGMRGLIVVGPDESLDPAIVGEFARRTGFPLLADAPGGLRGHGLRDMIAEADFLVTRRDFLTCRPDLLIRFGPAPVSSSVQAFVAGCRARVIQCDRVCRADDYLTPDRATIGYGDHYVLAAVARALAPGDGAWAAMWRDAAATCRGSLGAAVDRVGWSEVQAAALALGRDYALVHLANSLSLRLGNMLIGPSGDARAVHCNRGVSGIDGTIATFLGELAGRDARGLLLIGDLAAAHDASSLEAVGAAGDRTGVILVLNNGGGGLFDLLPVRTVPHYDALIRHRTRIDFRQLAGAYGLGFSRCGSAAECTAALGEAEARGGISLIEARFAPGAIRNSLGSLLAALARQQAVGAAAAAAGGG